MRPMHFLPLAGVLLGGFASAARAERVLARYDLDSLYDRSTAIVRGEMVNPAVVAVSAVFKGPLRPGDRVSTIDLDTFRRGPGLLPGDNRFEPLHAGDTVYLFLVPDDPHGLIDNDRPTNVAWSIIDSSVRVIDGGKVYAFGQWIPDIRTYRHAVFGSFGMVAMTPFTFPGVVIETQAEFENRLKRCPAAIEKVNTLLAAPVNAVTRQQIEALLKERADQAKAQQAINDDLSARLVARLGESAAPPELVAQLDRNPGFDVWMAVESTLRQPAGRDYLMGRLADPHETDERRLAFARILSDCGWRYRQELAGVWPADPAGPTLATRLARVAVGQLGTPLAEPLLRGVVDCADPAKPAAGPLQADLNAAAAVLGTAVDKAGPADRFALAETVMQVSPTQYRKLLPDAGPVLTGVTPADIVLDRSVPDRAPTVRHPDKGGLLGRSLHLKCRFRNRLDRPCVIKVVLRPTDGRPDALLDAATELGGKFDTFGSNWDVAATLPPDARGTYHVFLRALLDGKPAGDGIGYDLTVPAQ